MKGKELEIIQKLMEELQDEMQYGDEDLSERLGKGKPQVKMLEVEGELPLEGEESEMEGGLAMKMAKMEGESEEMPMEMGEDDDMEMEDEFDEEIGSFIPKNDPDEALKKRLMKIRG